MIKVSRIAQVSWRCLIVFIIVLLTACSNTSSNTTGNLPTVKIGYLPITHAAPLYIEQSIAGYSQFNLELVKFGSWPDLMDALNSGRIDGASVLIELAMKAKEQGVALKAVALGHRDGNVVITAPHIQSVEDLRGTDFAIPHPYSTHNILLYQMLKEAGMAYEDVQAIQLPPAEMPVALSEGRISGYIVAEPFGAKAVVLSKGKVLFQSEQLWPDSVDCALVLREKFIEEKRDIAEELVHWYKEAGKLAEADEAQAKEILATYMETDAAVLDLSLEWISYDNLRLEEADYELLRQYLIEMGLSEQPPTYEEFVDHTLFDKVS